MQLYAEIDRIFSGVQQVENAIDALHRQAQGRLLIGVMPGLSGGFVQRVVTAFLQARPGTYCYVEARNSEWIMESLVGRRLDVGLLSARMQSPFVESEMLGEHALVCILPIGAPARRPSRHRFRPTSTRSPSYRSVRKRISGTRSWGCWLPMASIRLWHSSRTSLPPYARSSRPARAYPWSTP